MRKTLLLISLISFSLAATEAAPRATPPPDGVHTVETILAITAPDQLMAELTTRLNAMNDLLDKAVDGPSAQRIRPEAERAWLETELINLRVSMLQPFADADLAKLKPFRDAYDKARDASERHHQRIRANPALLTELRTLFAPMGVAHAQDQLMRLTRIEHKTFLAFMQAKVIRMDIFFYRTQHGGQLPDIRNLGWDALTKTTAFDGTLDPQSKLGPYTKSIHKNPLTNRSKFDIIRGKPGPDFKSNLADSGFVYDEQSGEVHALDAQGRIINSDQPARADTR